MRSKKGFSLSLLKFLLLIITFALPQQTCAAEHHNRTCIPSSCGKITNITHPFRLKGDPPNCGHPGYELSCENNITLLHLFHSKSYRVEAINYNNFTIWLVDPAISQNDCSTLPRYSFSINEEMGKYEPLQDRVLLNGSTQVDYELMIDGSLQLQNEVRMFEHVVFLNCSNPVRDDPRYVDTAPCNKQEGNNDNVYAVLGDLAVGELRDECRVKMVAVSSFLVPPRSWDDSVFIQQNLSYSEIHRKLSYGFYLSWLQEFPCEEKCGMADSCMFNEITQNITCWPWDMKPAVSVCEYGYHTLFNAKYFFFGGPSFYGKCGNPSKLQIIVQDFAYGILQG